MNFLALLIPLCLLTLAGFFGVAKVVYNAYTQGDEEHDYTEV